MILFKNSTVILNIIMYVSCQRRVTNNSDVTTPKPYMVYIKCYRLNSTLSAVCGGTLIHENFILTSAACVFDAASIVVIAGYDKYQTNIESNPCNKATKRNVVYTYLPKVFQDTENKLHRQWVYHDVAVLQVDKPYSEADEDFKKLCSYMPKPIDVNQEDRYEAVGRDVMLLGWGQNVRAYPVRVEPANKKLQYTTSIIVDSAICMKSFDTLADYVSKYMICVHGKGRVNDNNKPIKTFRTYSDNRYPDTVGTRGDFDEALNTRRHSLCQDDHGGPLVTWINGRETIIGIATLYSKSGDRCLGPSIFNSVKKFYWLIRCALTMPIPDCITRRDMRTISKALEIMNDSELSDADVFYSSLE